MGKRKQFHETGVVIKKNKQWNSRALPEKRLDYVAKSNIVFEKEKATEMKVILKNNNS